ncbi:Spherulation-specific family 4, partial [Lasiosphaeris hirsuta]
SSTSSIPKRPFILVPLYIYPTPISWSPLFCAARSHPGLQFIAVVNPNNGPGSAPAPDTNYVAALRELSTLSNIKILGYIYCSYGKRSSVEMERDIVVYRAWTAQRGRGSDSPVDPDETPTLAIRIDGMFFDEAPSESEYVRYMANISGVARKALQNSQSAVIVYNPGMFVDRAFYESADYVAVFENRAGAWDSAYVCDNLMMLPEALRRRSVAISHS